MHFPTTDTTAYTTAFDGPVVDHRLERKITQTENASAMQDRSKHLQQSALPPELRPTPLFSDERKKGDVKQWLLLLQGC